MINILLNADQPETVFSVAAFILNGLGAEGEYKYIIIPFKAKDLNKDLRLIQADLDRKLLKIISNTYFSSMVSSERSKYALFGIYPADEVDAKEIAFFFDKNSDDIVGWFDNHLWPNNLLSFIYSQSKAVSIDNSSSFLKKLKAGGINHEWLEAEEAMANKNINHPLAGRYLKNFLLLKNNNDLDKTDYEAEANVFIFLHSAIFELVSGQENLGLTAGEVKFNNDLKFNSNLAENFSDKHPLFAEAKKRGRPVGCLVLNRVEDYFDAQAVIEKGLDKFPWLCILGYEISNKSYILFKSRYLPISGSASAPNLNGNCFLQLLKELSKEVIK